ncbi:MAG TPA: sn-glycerol-3-phosphate ABC transporter ATP-binding protein UgpC [Streptosporangiaceae bacterium]
MAKIALEDITKRFGSDVYAVDRVSLEIDDGEFMVLVGPSGCGKTTILRIVAGLEEVTAGEVYIGGRQVTDLAPKDRDVAMVFQNYALYPHMTVEQNLGFGLRLRRMPRANVRKKVVETATTLAIEALLARKPVALSGGQRQRVAMGRAMARLPEVFLMDEPLSNLDAKLRVQMRAELARLRDRLRTTTIYVTHDQVEAMTLGDRVAVLKDGRLQQVATPTELFNHPANLFVAAFIGSPSMNLVEARISGGTVSFGPYSLPLPPGVALSGHASDTVALGIRPSDLEDADVWHSDLPTIEAQVDVIEELGSEVHVLFTVDAPPVITEDTKAAVTAEEGEDIIPLEAAAGKTPFTARVDARTAARPGGSVRLSMDPRRIHFFNPQTGLAIGQSPDRASAPA